MRLGGKCDDEWACSVLSLVPALKGQPHSVNGVPGHSKWGPPLIMISARFQLTTLTSEAPTTSGFKNRKPPLSISLILEYHAFEHTQMKNAPY